MNLVIKYIVFKHSAAVVLYLTMSRSWSSSASFTKSVLLTIVRSARAICLKKKSTNRLLAILLSLVWVCVCEKKKESKQDTKDQSHRIAFHTLYYCLQIPHSLIYAKDGVRVCLSRSINTHSLLFCVGPLSLLFYSVWVVCSKGPTILCGKKTQTETETMASDTCKHSSVLK